jgi:iron complex outermembrane recepter protein
MTKHRTNGQNLNLVAMLSASTAFCAIVAVAGPVWAQTAEAKSDEGEIVVTARRTEERLQDVPVAVTAFSGAALAERRIASESDLQAVTPGLTVRQTASSNDLNFALRGQSIDSFSYSSPAVTAYFNEVQTGGGSATSFFDLDSIQVLKGPQGTLFGRNATGGAVLYGTVKPNENFGGYLKAGYGNYSNTEVEGAVNIPLAEGFAVRIAGKVQKRDGYETNLINGDKLASIDAKTGRISILMAPPGTKLDNVLVYQYGSYGGNNGSVKMTNAYGVNGAPTTYFDPVTGTTKSLTLNSLAYGPGGPFAATHLADLGFTDIGDFLTKQAKVDYYDVYSDRAATHRAKQNFVSNTTNYELTENMRLKNIFGYNRVTSLDPTEIDGSPYEFLTVGGGTAPNDQGYARRTEQMSNELQLSGDAFGGNLTYILGAFISKEETYNRIPLCVLCDTGLSVPGAIGFVGRYDFTITDESKALFAQGNYALSDKLTATIGARYTWEDVSISNGSDSNLILQGVTQGLNRSDAEPSWLFGLDYKVTDDLMVYVNQRGSWRTGGFNGTSANASPKADTFNPEKTYDVEVGAKFSGELAGRRTRLNLAVYDQIVKDAQRSPYIGISAVAGNVGEAEIRGLELDGSINLTDWLEVGGSYAYTHAEFTDNRATGRTDLRFRPVWRRPRECWFGIFSHHA